ncbi:MAG TPA: hypothetical protein VF116_02665, partial [Ktedonobacterales bacterium]
MYHTPFPVRLGAALVAAALGLLASLAARYILGIASPAELFGDRLTVLVPLPIFERLLAIFGSNAKHLYFGGVVVAQGVLTALVGAFYWTLRDRVLGATRAGRPPDAPTESATPSPYGVAARPVSPPPGSGDDDPSPSSSAASASSAVNLSPSAASASSAVNSLAASHPPHALDAVALTLLLWLLSAGIFAPLIGAGFFGAALLGGV